MSCWACSDLFLLLLFWGLKVKPQYSRCSHISAENRRISTSLDLLAVLLLAQSSMWLYLIFMCSGSLTVATGRFRVLQNILIFPHSDWAWRLHWTGISSICGQDCNLPVYPSSCLFFFFPMYLFIYLNPENGEHISDPFCLLLWNSALNVGSEECTNDSHSMDFAGLMDYHLAVKSYTWLGLFITRVYWQFPLTPVRRFCILLPIGTALYNSDDSGDGLANINRNIQVLALQIC